MGVGPGFGGCRGKGGGGHAAWLRCAGWGRGKGGGWAGGLVKGRRGRHRRRCRLAKVCRSGGGAREGGGAGGLSKGVGEGQGRGGAWLRRAAEWQEERQRRELVATLVGRAMYKQR